jgi:hypothetical protein
MTVKFSANDKNHAVGKLAERPAYLAAGSRRSEVFQNIHNCAVVTLGIMPNEPGSSTAHTCPSPDRVRSLQVAAHERNEPCRQQHSGDYRP